MQELDENMDELLRKAAEKYGVKPGASNWDFISSQLQHEMPVDKHKKNSNIYKLLLLLLVVTFLTGLTIFYFPAKQVNNIADTYKEQANASKEVVANTNDNAAVQNNASKEIAGLSTGNNVNTMYSHVYNVKQNQQEFNVAVPADKNNNGNPISASSKNREEESNFLNNTEVNVYAENDSININNINADQPLTKAGNEAGTENKSVIKLMQERRNNSGLYVGLVAGVAINSIKYQQAKTGFDIGAISGYRFNKNIAIETGLLYSNRKYYSNGKYFSMDKMSSTMPEDMHIMYLDGKSSILEIPVNINYSFINNRHDNIYASAGVNSYILTNEINNYMTELDGTEKIMKGSYKQSSGYFAAAVNLSLGYEHKLGKNNTIRISPYMQIPLKGIGIGELPVASAGLHIAGTFSLHR